MIFFTTLGIAITSLLLYSLLFIIIIFIVGGFNENNIFMAVVAIGVIMSLIIAYFIVKPEDFGYQKITVSENTMEENI